MSTTLQTHEWVTLAATMRAGDDVLVETQHGAEWVRVTAVSRRNGVTRYVRADGHTARRADAAAVFIRRSVTR